MAVRTNTIPGDAGRVKTNHRGQRIVVSIGAAAVITLGLFTAMKSLIASEFVAPAETVKRELTILVYTGVDEPATTRRDRVVKRPKVSTPPPMTKPRGPMTKVNLPELQIKGETPSLPRGNMGGIYESRAIMINPRSVTPISPPIVVYPEDAVRRGIQGKCDVSMDVSDRGKPFNIVATCSHPVFQREAKRAISKVEFLPMIGDKGRAVERRNVVYPLEFKLEQ